MANDLFSGFNQQAKQQSFLNKNSGENDTARTRAQALQALLQPVSGGGGGGRGGGVSAPETSLFGATPFSVTKNEGLSAAIAEALSAGEGSRSVGPELSRIQSLIARALGGQQDRKDERADLENEALRRQVAAMPRGRNRISGAGGSGQNSFNRAGQQAQDDQLARMRAEEDRQRQLQELTRNRERQQTGDDRQSQLFEMLQGLIGGAGGGGQRTVTTNTRIGDDARDRRTVSTTSGGTDLIRALLSALG